MKCPLCKTGKLAFCQDTIVAYKINSRKGNLSIGKELTKNHLDNTWVECSECCASSDRDSCDFSEELKTIYDKL